MRCGGGGRIGAGDLPRGEWEAPRRTFIDGSDIGGTYLPGPPTSYSTPHDNQGGKKEVRRRKRKMEKDKTIILHFSTGQLYEAQE